LQEQAFFMASKSADLEVRHLLWKAWTAWSLAGRLSQGQIRGRSPSVIARQLSPASVTIHSAPPKPLTPSVLREYGVVLHPSQDLHPQVPATRRLSAPPAATFPRPPAPELEPSTLRHTSPSLTSIQVEGSRVTRRSLPSASTSQRILRPTSSVLTTNVASTPTPIRATSIISSEVVDAMASWAGMSRHAEAASPPKRSASAYTRPLSRERVRQASQALAKQCPRCSNIYMADAIYCRHCGLKRGMVQAENSILSGTFSAATLSPTTPPKRELAI